MCNPNTYRYRLCLFDPQMGTQVLSVVAEEFKDNELSDFGETTVEAVLDHKVCAVTVLAELYFCPRRIFCSLVTPITSASVALIRLKSTRACGSGAPTKTL